MVFGSQGLSSLIHKILLESCILDNSASLQRGFWIPGFINPLNTPCNIDVIKGDVLIFIIEPFVLYLHYQINNKTMKKQILSLIQKCIPAYIEVRSLYWVN